MKRQRLLDIYFVSAVLAVLAIAYAPGPASKWLSVLLAVFCILAMRLWAEDKP